MSILCFAGFEGFDCSILWIIMILLFFIAAVIRRQLNEFTDMGFSLIGSVILAEIGFVIAAFIFHSFRWAFLVGLIALLVGGFLGGPIIGDTGEE